MIRINDHVETIHELFALAFHEISKVSILPKKGQQPGRDLHETGAVCLYHAAALGYKNAMVRTLDIHIFVIPFYNVHAKLIVCLDTE